MFPDRFLQNNLNGLVKRKKAYWAKKIQKYTNDLQSDQIGETFEDVYVQTADAVVGQVSETQGKKALLLFLPHFRNKATWQL